MIITGIDYIAVVIAAIAAFVWSMIYYIGLFKYWREAAGWSVGEVKGRRSRATYIMTFVALTIMSWTFAGPLSGFGANSLTPKSGAIDAVFIWLGFIVPIIAVNRVIGGRKNMLAVIDGIHWLGVLLIEGAFIGVFSSAS